MLLATMLPISDINGLWCTCDTASDHSRFATSWLWKLGRRWNASSEIAPISGAGENWPLVCENAQATSHISVGLKPPGIFLRSSPDAASNIASSEMPTFANALTILARSDDLKLWIFSRTALDIAWNSRWSFTWSDANEDVMMASGFGGTSWTHVSACSTNSSLRSLSVVTHCAIAQDNCDKLCAVNVFIFLRHSFPRVFTSTSFHKLHFAKAHAVCERWLDSKLLMLSTTSAASTGIRFSLRAFIGARFANPTTSVEMPCGDNLPASFVAVQATNFRTSVTVCDGLSFPNV
mmetsp:Transcript_119228/g.320005  ORF Transcript_119228/g.320005 Transcript_119228/m.320005 type:complete len:292 (+) Transcript_119228:1307-2182(+)